MISPMRSTSVAGAIEDPPTTTLVPATTTPQAITAACGHYGPFSQFKGTFVGMAR